MRKRIYALIACIVLLCSLGWAHKSTRVTWEYKVVVINELPEGAKKALDLYGSEGWELTSVQLVGVNASIGSGYFYFKRTK